MTVRSWPEWPSPGELVGLVGDSSWTRIGAMIGMAQGAALVLNHPGPRNGPECASLIRHGMVELNRRRVRDAD